MVCSRGVKYVYDSTGLGYNAPPFFGWFLAGFARFESVSPHKLQGTRDLIDLDV